MVYTKEFLISKLHRFELENGKSPVKLDMQIKFGYPGYDSYIRNFGSWNNALLEAGLEVNQYQVHKGNLDGTEICDNCGCLKKVQWNYKNKQRLCPSCYMNSDYTNGNLDPDSKVGFGFIGQRIVAKTLGLELKYDCNCSQGFGAPDDLYDVNKYKYINVKAATLNKNNAWKFGLINKYTPDTYILLAFSADKSDIEHVWITDAIDDLAFNIIKNRAKTIINIKNNIYSGLKRAEPWEVDAKPYNDAYHNMSLENCSVLRK